MDPDTPFSSAGPYIKGQCPKAVQEEHEEQREYCSTGKVSERLWRFLGLSWTKPWLTWHGFADSPAAHGRAALGSVVLLGKLLLWLCHKKVQLLSEVTFWSDLFIWEALVSLYFSFERWKRLNIIRSWVEDLKHCPSKHPLLLSPQWEPKVFSSAVPLQSGDMFESLGQNVPSSLVPEMMKETNQAQFLVMLLFRVAAVNCVSELRVCLHIFLPIWHVNVSDMLRDLIGMTALKRTGGND